MDLDWGILVWFACPACSITIIYPCCLQLVVEVVVVASLATVVAALFWWAEGSEDLQASTVTYGWLNLKSAQQKQRVCFLRQSFVVEKRRQHESRLKKKNVRFISDNYYHLKKAETLTGASELNKDLQNTACERAITQVTWCFLTPLQSGWTSCGGSSSWGKCLNATRLIRTANWSTTKDPMKFHREFIQSISQHRPLN